MISQTAEYALRAIVHMATNPAEPQTAQQISEGTHVPVPYLSKVLQSLVRGNLVLSQRGLHGGFTLRKCPEDLTVYEIVQAVDPIQRILTCPLGLKAHGTHLCPLHRRLDDAMDQVERSFRATTIAEVLSEPTTSKPLCPFPVEVASGAKTALPKSS
ncbi:MAG TPA: Rrf2 family transcriptional regulator [Chthonomonadaceae bacterium]|nr:Rrf2 family transcriptional regulator [Chthonomonadaceae bacterium]